MRIIGGQFKGKKISFLKSSLTRPLKDLVKESLFNIITHSNSLNIKIKDSNVLDLYSGVGSFGIECLSREARNVTFVENNSEALKILKENLKKIPLNENNFVFSGDIQTFFTQVGSNNKFDIIFFDPPFAENKYIDEIGLIKKLKIFNKEHLIIIHREKKKEEDFNKILNVKIIKDYGRSRLVLGTLI